MKAALSIVLAALLIILPVEQVLAQASQQANVGIQQADGAARLFHVPPLTENAALLLRASSDRALLDTPFADAPLVQQDPGGWWAGLSDWERIGVMLGGIVVIGAIAGGINAAGENDDPDSFKSKHNVAEGAGIYALWAIPATALGVLIVYSCKFMGCT